MKRLRFTIVKNVIANLIRGGASAIVALALPHFLVKSLDHDRFAAWALMLQIAAYATYLDFGVQTAVARFVARYMELGDEKRRDSLISTALAFLIAAAILAIAIFSVIVWRLPHFFPGVPAHLLTELRSAVLVMGVGASCLLPLSTFSGVLVGLHRNEHVALAIGGSRLLGAIIVVVLAARQTTSLLVLGACIAVINLLGGTIQVMAAKYLLPSLRLSWSNVQRSSATELGKFCAGLTVWSISMLLVTGLGITIVGIVDFQAVGYYSVAASFVTIFSGANGTVCSAFIAPVAALHASKQNDRIRTLVIAATRVNTFANLLATTAIFMFGHSFLRVWVGESYARQALPILELLMVGNAVRLIANPYASMLIATGQQRHGIAQGLVESLTNLGSSIVGAILVGPIGVALGTVIGALCVVIWTCVVTLKRATEITISRGCFVFEGIIRPFICTLPLVLFSTTMHRPMSLQSAALLGVCILLTGILTGSYGKVLPTSQWLRKRFSTS
jgi:O-antigen/teichoic acid export membrane protein